MNIFPFNLGIVMYKPSLFPLLLCVALFCGCLAPRQIQKLIDQRTTHYWAGEVGAEKYQLMLDSADGIWFEGQLIRENGPAWQLKGFEKGQNHVTQIFPHSSMQGDSLRGQLFIWTRGSQADTVEIENPDGYADLPGHILLLKHPYP